MSKEMNNRELLIELYNHPLIRELLVKELLSKRQLVELVLLEEENEDVLARRQPADKEAAAIAKKHKKELPVLKKELEKFKNKFTDLPEPPKPPNPDKLTRELLDDYKEDVYQAIRERRYKAKKLEHDNLVNDFKLEIEDPPTEPEKLTADAVERYEKHADEVIYDALYKSYLKPRYYNSKLATWVDLNMVAEPDKS